ncbi:MAG: sugar phosphate isomerase/epimerase family protein [Candidatus Hydrogenedentota bacterium]
MGRTGMIRVVTTLLLAGLTVACATKTLHAADTQTALGDIEYRLACRLANYGDYQDVALPHLRNIGVRYVFANVPAPGDAGAEMARLAEYGLKPLVIRGSADLSKESSVEELGQQVAVCETMGVKYMFLSAKRHDAPKEVAYERLRRAGDIAAQHGVTIALETHPDLGTNGDVHLETMKAIDHPNIRVNFDTANITYYNRNTDAVAELKKIIDYVATVEIKDHTGEFETWNFPAVGQGKVDVPSILELLREHGYRGPITLEFEGIKGVELSETETKLAIAESIAYIRSLGRFE